MSLSPSITSGALYSPSKKNLIHHIQPHTKERQIGKLKSTFLLNLTSSNIVKSLLNKINKIKLINDK
jgi:hypothetical protein